MLDGQWAFLLVVKGDHHAAYKITSGFLLLKILQQLEAGCSFGARQESSLETCNEGSEL